MELIQFDPKEADLHAIVSITQSITAADLEDQKQLAVVRENRIALKNARVQIEKQGKALRDDALKFQRSVIAKEKELIAIIEPEENRLQSIEQSAKELAERKKRVATLPQRLSRLASIGDIVEVTDEAILDMGDQAFEAYVSQRVEAKLEAERVEIEKREQALKAEEEKAKRAVELKEAEERARVAERERIEREAKLAEERRELEEHRAKEKAEAEEKELQSEKRYQAFLREHGFSEETKSDFHITRTATTATLYKLGRCCTTLSA